MRNTTTRRLTALACTSALFAAACSSGDDEGGPADDPTTTEATTPTTQAEVPATTSTTDDDTTTTTEADDDGEAVTNGDGGSPDVITAADGVLSDGIWAVGDAGTVEFAVGDGGLELIDVVANDGWQVSIDEESPDEIEVDFESGNLEYEIEIEYENGILEIEIDLDIEPAEAGTFDLGPAGTVSLSTDGATVTLDDLTVADGWSLTEQDTEDGEVEIELRRDNVQWELDAEIDDGQLEVEIDFEIEGRFP